MLLFTEYGSINGGENSFLAIAPQLQRLGWQISAAVPPTCSAGKPTELATRLGELQIPVVPFSTRDNAGLRLSQDGIRERVRQRLAANPTDVVLCNSLSTSRLVGPVTAALGIPAAGYLRDIIRLSKKAISDISELDKIIAVSNATAAYHIQAGMPEPKVQVIYNGVDNQAFFPSDRSALLHKELGIGPQESVLLFVGQIGMRKGVDTLLAAFQQVASHRAPRGSHLLIVGQRHSTKDEAIEHEAALRGHSGRIESETPGQIHWLGRRTDIPHLMQTAHVLVHPARQEPLGRVLLEAFACGLPAVATSVGGTPEIFAGLERFNLLSSPDDPQGLASRIVGVLESATLGSEIGSEQRKIAQERFSIKKCVDKLHSTMLNLR